MPKPTKRRGPYRKRRFVREIRPTPEGWPKIIEWRVYLQWTQEDLADKTGLSVGSISSLEGQEVGFSQDSLKKLSQAFGITVGVLFDVNPNEDPEWWQLWSGAGPPERQRIIAYAQGLLTRKQ